MAASYEFERKITREETPTLTLAQNRTDAHFDSGFAALAFAVV